MFTIMPYVVAPAHVAAPFVGIQDPATATVLRLMVAVITLHHRTELV